MVQTLNVTNGANQGQNNKTHTSYPNIGNVTALMTLPNNANPCRQFRFYHTRHYDFSILMNETEDLYLLLQFYRRG